MRALQLLIAASIVAFGALSSAATAAPIVGALQIDSGSGSVNSGSGFRPVAEAAEVAGGDSVMVAPGGRAEIVYYDNCRVSVTPGKVAVVAPVSPCARGQADTGHKAETEDNSSYYLLGGAAAAGVGVGIWALAKGSSTSPKPASP